MATIEKVLSIKFPFIRDLGIANNPFYKFFSLPLVGKRPYKESNCTVRNNIKTKQTNNIKKDIHLTTQTTQIVSSEFLSSILIKQIRNSLIRLDFMQM